ncbi:cytochrome P450 [Hyaloscypha bicolor E]|uniref:Cytochrome P450 n=1 Tax=Hyaloscypha bicolor E TaxID=1095630 RepID=A0A2J6T8T9_9HELO|nr:cytochrome P450 [Hyaloscypha bicolor E]PMD59449.1 cytochrome P450 [Hyaloscypha bicolor E]
MASVLSRDLAIWVVIIAVAYILFCIIIYRVYIHPLSKYPGPFLWKISRLPQTYYLFRGTLPWKIHQLHEKYGPVVRLAPNELSYTTVDAWHDIYTRLPDRSQLKKDLSFAASGASKAGENGPMLELDDEQHARLRRNMSHAFSNANLREQEPIIMKYTNQSIDLLKSQAGEPVDLSEIFNFLTFDIAGDMVFGDSFNCLTSATLHPWINFIFARISGAALISAAAKFWPFSFLFTPFIDKKLLEGDLKHATLSKERLDARLKIDEARGDFTTHLLRKLNDPHGISYLELVETSRMLIVGGAETTATLLTGLLYYLLSSQSPLTKKPYLFTLTAAIRKQLSSPSEITLPSLETKDLAYLSASINEGLRLFPPIPGNLRRIVPKGGKLISGNWVPAGTLVAVNVLSANTYSGNFLYPHEFRPERWFKDAKGFEGDNLGAVKPFSLGPRNCIGKGLAIMEMKLILTTLLWHFDIELAEESKDWMDRVRVIGFFVKPKLMVKLKEKEGSAEEFRQWELAHGLDNAAPNGAKLEVESL